jgi:dTDP-4-dehydrorhamnose 3,5-epimerase-like enzyme
VRLRRHDFGLITGVSVAVLGGLCMNLNGVRMLEFPQHGDERGHLVVVESITDVPSEIKRVFYLYGSDADVVRGQHANRRTEFVLINVAGKSKVDVRDGRGNEATFSLNRPHTGIYLPRMVWKDMYDFSPDSVLLVLASEHYDAAEYIRDYDEFAKEAIADA